MTPESIATRIIKHFHGLTVTGPRMQKFLETEFKDYGKHIERQTMKEMQGAAYAKAKKELIAKMKEL